MCCCNETEALFSSYIFWTGEILKLIAAPSSTLLNILLLYLLSHCRPLHINVRNLLVNLAACNMFNGFYVTGKSVLIMNSIARGRFCMLTSTNVPQLCSFQTGIFIATLFSTVGTFAAMHAERLYATIRIGRYEAKPKASLSIFLLFGVWTVTIICASGIVATVKQSKPLPLCNELLNINPTASAAIVSITSSIQVVGLILYVGLWLYNRRKVMRQRCQRESRRQVLAYRLESQKSLATMEMLLPSIVLNAVTWSVINLFTLVSAEKIHGKTHSGSETVNYFIASQYFFYLIVLVQGIFHPLLFIWHLPPTTIRLPFAKGFLSSMLPERKDEKARFAKGSKKNLLIDQISDKETRVTVIPRHLEYCDLGILLDMDNEEVIKVDDFYERMSIVSSIKQLNNAIDIKI
ncbi:Serpentine receptor class alpha [Trichuris trichiura]|uniref:Serpentine receptor class alpha n=1 Tax=Trichuris trichiura TaxID=36087 RepID=A0A077ZA09_TRITR|nr:Serpentine receptor class alpha [Trichuris trichiura]